MRISNLSSVLLQLLLLCTSTLHTYYFYLRSTMYVLVVGGAVAKCEMLFFIRFPHRATHTYYVNKHYVRSTQFSAGKRALKQGATRTPYHTNA